MYARILVPLDGSQQAEAALPYAEALAHLAPTTLYLVRAVEPNDVDAATHYLEAVSRRVRAAGWVAEVHAVHGPPAEMIVWEAARLRADLVVMATNDRMRPGRGMVGSVADQVVLHAARPVLLVRPGQPVLPARAPRVLVPLDGTVLAEEALLHARAIAGADGEILLYRAVSPAASLLREGAGDSVGGDEELPGARADATRYLDEKARALRAAGHKVSTVVETAPAAAGIAAQACGQRVDLIVLSSHGRGDVARWLLGSVASELTRCAPVPLLLLRPRLALERGARPTAGAQARRLSAELPPKMLQLTGRQRGLVSVALESLLWEVADEPEVAADVRALLELVGAGSAMDSAAEPGPVAAQVGARVPTPSGRPASPPVDLREIHPGCPVFAHRVDTAMHADPGQFVGVIEDVLDREGVHYLYVRGGLEGASELYLPLAAVRAVAGKQVHLSLSVEDLVGQAWHRPPAPDRATWGS